MLDKLLGLHKWPFTHSRGTPVSVWHVRLVAFATALMGLINVLSAVTPSVRDRVALIRYISPLTVRQGGHLTAALAGFALLLLANGLWRRKHIAWLLTLVVLGVSALSHLLKGLDYEEALLATVLAGWLLYLRPAFHARSDPPSIRQGVRVLVASVLFTLAYGVIGFFLLDRHFRVDYRWLDALHQTWVMFTEFYDPGLEPLTGFGRFFAGSIYVIGATTIGYALVMLVRPVLVRQPATAQERAHAQTIVENFGCSSLARMVLFPDKSYYFSPGGSVIGYVAKGQGALALGDPIGPPADRAAAIKGFAAFCQQNDWTPAFYQTLPDEWGHYQRAGFASLGIGHEGIVDLASFTLSGNANKSVRTAVNRLTKLGYRAECYEPPLSASLVDELRSISDDWLTFMHGSEMRFSMGWFDTDYITHSQVVAIHAPDGAISAFANLLPAYQHNQASVDLMRRRAEVENGTMDFLFVSLFAWAKTQGCATFNLGLSALWGIGERRTDPRVERLLRYIYQHVSEFYNFQGLHAFKEKFHPHWSPRYLVYPNPTALPAVLWTLGRATVGDDLLWEQASSWVLGSLGHIPTR
jgi:phosphatidylglycerol lysyltransferase